MSESLKITETFLSLQGESKTSGCATVFVRLTGCPLRCGYCDSAYAFYGGQRMLVQDIVAEVLAYGVAKVCVTGGEPLAQPDVLVLLRRLCDQGLEVSLETSGALSVASVDERVSIVMDIKTPGSGEVSRNLWQNLELLKLKDQIKFVLCDRQDYEWARFKLTELSLCERVGEVLFSPCYETLKPRDLADWIVADRLSVRFQIQLHKLLWGDVPGV